MQKDTSSQENEFESVDQQQENLETTAFKDFVENITDSDTLFIGMKDGDLAALESKWKQFAKDKPASVICFWSTREAAKSAIATSWPEHELVEVPIQKFLANYLTSMSVDYIYAGLDFSDKRYGIEVDPLDLAIAVCQKLREKAKDFEFANFDGIDDLEKKARKSKEGS